MKMVGVKIVFLLIVFSCSVYSSNIKLVHADSLVTWYNSDSVFVTKFLGNVFVEHDDIDISSAEMNYVKIRDYLILQHQVKILKESGEYFYSDSTKYFKKDKVIKASGSILAGFTQDSLKIYGDSIVYFLDENDKYGWVWHRPTAMKIKVQDTLKLIGDSIYVNRKDSLLKSLSNVFIGSGKNNIISDSTTYYYNQDSVNVMGIRPKISTTKDTLIGDVIYGKFRKKTSLLKKVDIVGDVDIRSSNKEKNEINHVSGELVEAFFKNSDNQNIDFVNVYGSPRGSVINIEKRDTILYSADSMFVYFDDSSSVKEIYLIGNSKYIMKKYENPDNDKLYGDILKIFFENSQPVKAKVKNHAKLENHSEDNGRRTINNVSGDSINVNFDNGQVDNVDFEGRIEGQIISFPK